MTINSFNKYIKNRIIHKIRYHYLWIMKPINIIYYFRGHISDSTIKSPFRKICYRTFVDLLTDAKDSSKGPCKTDGCTHVSRKVAAKLRKLRGTVVNTVDSRSALNRVWSYKQFGRTGCLVEEIPVLYTIFTRFVSTNSNVMNQFFRWIIYIYRVHFFEYLQIYINLMLTHKVQTNSENIIDS